MGTWQQGLLALAVMPAIPALAACPLISQELGLPLSLA